MISPDRLLAVEMPESRWRAVLAELERMDGSRPVTDMKVGEHSEHCFQAMRHLRVALGPSST